jgi:flagellin
VFSVQTNPAATQALQNLASARAQSQITQGQLSTGRKLTGPRDNAADYIISNNLKAAMAEGRVLKDAQLRTQSVLEVTQYAIGNISDMLTGLKERATQLADSSISGTSAEALRSEINTVTRQIDRMAKSATFDGINLIGQPPPGPDNWGRPYAGFVGFGTDYATYGTAGRSGRMDIYFDVRNAVNQNVQIDWGDGNSFSSTVTGSPPTTYSSVISHTYDNPGYYQMHYNISVSGTAGAGFNIGGVNFTPDADITTVPVSEGGGLMNLVHKPMLTEFLGLDDTTSLTPEQLVATLDNARNVADQVASYYGFRQKDIERLIAHTMRLSDTREKAYGDLVDADMGKLSATWQAQQSKAQLATQSLSIANQAPKLLLGLFG